MSKMKRILALTLCLLLAITSLPVTQLVFADEATEIVSFHETKLNSASDVTWTNDSKVKFFDYMTWSLDSEGYGIMNQTTTSGSGTNSLISATRPIGEIKIAEDVTNRTEVITNNIDGKYKIELELEALVKKHAEASEGYFSVEFFSGTTPVLFTHLRGTYIDVCDNSTYKKSTYMRNTKNWDGIEYSADTTPQVFKLTYEIDTVNNTLSSYYGDTLLTHSAGALVSEDKDCEIATGGNPIDTIRFFETTRIDEGSYVKFKEIKVTQLERAENATLSALPEKLAVADVNNVTETSVTLPTVTGVTWGSADTTVATVSGSTLTFIPSTTGTKEAKVTATFETDGYEYVKTYSMTLAQEEEVVVPEPTPTPSEGIVSVYETFNYADVNTALADGWSYGIFNNKTYAFTPNETLNADFVVENGIPMVKQTVQTIMKADNSGVNSDHGTAMVFKLPAGPVATDVENGTSIINEDGKYHGIIKVDIDGEFNVDPAEAYYHTPEGSETSFSVSAGYANVNVIGDYIATQWRIRAIDARAMSNSSEKPSDIKTEENENTLGGVPKDGIIMSAEVDTVEETVKACVPETGNGLTGSGTTWAKLTDKKDLTYVDRIITQHMVRLPLTAYSKIESVKVTTIDPKFGDETTAVLNQLPAKLVSDINGATELSVSLPEISGVEWVSMDEDAATVSGNTLNLLPSKTGAKEAVVKATFTTDGIKYSKEYKFTLAKNENLSVTYYVDGSVYSTVAVKINEKASEINAPAREHYNFIGWYEEGADSAFDFDTAITDNVNLHAKYDAKTYNVIFKADGNTVATLSGKYNDVVTGTIPAVPAKIGYTAIGWCVGDSDEVFGTGTLITGPDMIINAKYAEGSLEKHTVTFKVEGNQYATETVFDGYTVAMPENPTKENYTFAYWTLDGVEFKADTAIKNSIVLEAKFNPNTIKVNFYMDDAMTELFQTGTGYYNTAYGTLPVPVKDTYKFKGWKKADGNDFTEDTVVTEEVSVYATWESSVKVILDEDITKYTSAKGNNVEFIDTTTTWTESFIDDGYVVRVTKQSPEGRTIEDILTAAIKAPIGEYDAENRTQIYNSKFVGDYEIEIVFDSKLSGKYTAADGTVVNAPYGYISSGYFMGTTFYPLLANRMLGDRIQSMNSTNSKTNSFNATGEVGTSTTYTYPRAVDGVVKDISVKIRYNTVEGKAYMTVNDSNLVATGYPMAKLGYINAFYMSTMPCNRVDDFVRIKRVKVTQYNDYSDSEDVANINKIFAELPVSIVENPFDAKGTLTLPEIRGVKWSSTDETVVNTETGKITPWYDDTDVIVSATVSSGYYSYEKFYTLTVKGSARETEEIINHTFTSEDDLLNWSFTNLDDVAIGSYSVDENGVKISKITTAEEPDKEYETKKYFAFYDLYDAVDSADYSVTEVKDHRGVYDVTVDYSKFANSKLPVNVAVGYRNGNSFYDFGMLEFSSEGTLFTYQETGETRATVLLNDEESAKITFRIDNNNNEICLFRDGKMITDRLSIESVMGEEARLNTVKVELDTNNELGDYVTVKGISVTKVVENNISELNAIVNASENLDVYDITANPESVSGTINKLPETIGGYDVVWSTSSNQVDLESGEVFHDTTAKKVYLYAEIYDADAKYPYVVRKAFELNVRAAVNGEEIDRFIINSLGRVTNQDYDDIRYDLAIPQVDGITWTSSNNAIIDNNGIINKNATITEATPVVITASSNGVSKKYNLIVSPRTALETVATGTNSVSVTMGDITNAKLSGDVVTRFTYTKGENGKVNIVDDKGNILVSLVSDENGFHFDYNGSDYKKYNPESANIEIISMPDIDKAAIFVDGELVADYVPFKINTDYISAVVSEINVGTITILMNKYGILQSNIDNFEYFNDAKFGYAGKNGITLPTTTFTNATVTWTSADTSVLSNDGKVTTPVAMRLVNLTFKIADNENSNVFIDKLFEVAVDCADDKNLIYTVVPNVEFNDLEYHQSNSTDGKSETIFRVVGSNVRDFEIVFNLGETKLFNAMYILQKSAKMEKFKIYSSNDGNDWNYIASDDMTNKCSKLVRFENTNASYIKLVIGKTAEINVDIAELKLFFNGTAVELAEYDINNVNIDTTPTGTSINLPENGAHGTVFTWESSNEDVIDTDGNITRPQSATTITLTVKAVVDGKELTREFPVFVDTKSTSGPSQVGGGSGGGGGGSASGGASSAPIIGGGTGDTVYGDETKPEEVEPITPINTNYNDVKVTDWYYDAVMTLTEKGVVSGDGTGYFNPKDNVTREQFVKMILEAIEIETVEGENKFTDVIEGAWYVDYIVTASELGIVNGLAKTHFGVGSNISRQDMAVLIERVLDYKEIEIEKSEVEPFDDISEVSDYATDAVSNMKAIGLIQGYNNMYNPKDNLTRAEAATVISSLLKLLAK